jgi:hypothetical protein
VRSIWKPAADETAEPSSQLGTPAESTAPTEHAHVAAWPYSTNKNEAEIGDAATTPDAFGEGDRVEVKADARGPNGKRMKVCGRVGRILRYAAGVSQIQFDDGTSHMNVPGDCLELIERASYSSAEGA